MELALLGDMITAAEAEAERIGMVNRSIPVERFKQEVRVYAKRVSSIAPRVSELILTGLRHLPTMDRDTTLEWGANAIAMVVPTPEARQTVKSFKAEKERRAADG